MLLPVRLPLLRYLAAGFLLSSNISVSGTITSAPSKSSPTEIAELPKTCEARTINYITDSLPQLCLKSSWSVANGTGTHAKGQNGTTEVGAGDDIASSNSSTGSVEEVSSTSASAVEAESTAETKEAVATDLETGELNEASFLSFEEWKKQTLDKAGQGNDIGKKKAGDGKKRDSEGIQNHLDSLGDEGEIDLDFGAFRSGGKGEEAAQTTENKEAEGRQEVQETEARTKDQYRSKDAGKTCKERFSYASFDAGATVLKTHPGAKNAKSVLIENKDSYMLSECSAENKFIIIELSEDIWIDTLVLANYEFFSSMIRTFRVSVSDKYPVKMEKWKDLGTYEARNSREIQAFLIENPQIWARYLRIEFLSHYGNEYYCPLSLVRVHGTRMLESWKETEAGGDEDLEEIGGGEEQYVPEAVAEVVQEEERLQAELEAQLANAEPVPTTVTADQPEESASVEDMICLWEKPGFYLFDLPESGPADDICLPSEAPTQTPPEAQPSPSEGIKSTPESIPLSTQSTAVVSLSTEPTATLQASHPEKLSPTESSSTKESASTVPGASNGTHSVPDNSIPPTSTTATITKSHNITSSLKNKTTSTTSAASSLPTIQESFFKAVSRRLQLLETNSTLSLKYIEEQSKILREAFTKVEKKQLQKTTTFLDTLNSTVLDELRGFRQQYDEIWQSTVISLESQRDESRREILAISTRLNILADEVVFQKRMSIVQSILLLLCLGLVIFSRVSGGGNIDFPTFHTRNHSHGRITSYPNRLESPLDRNPSPPASPDFQRVDSGRRLETGHRRVHSDDIDTAVSRSRSRDESPPTPISTYSRSDEHALTPPSGADDLHLSAPTEDIPILSDPLEANVPSTSITKEESASSSENNTPKKRRRKTSIRSIRSTHQEETPPPDAHPQHPPPLPPRQITTTNISPIAEDTTSTSRLPSPPPDSQPHSSSSPESRGMTETNTTPNRNFTITRKPLPSLPEGT